MPASAAYFGSYEIIQRSLVPAGGDRSDLSISKTIFAGGLAGVFNWIVGIPPDVVKSRLQTGEDANEISFTCGVSQQINLVIFFSLSFPVKSHSSLMPGKNFLSSESNSITSHTTKD